MTSEAEEVASLDRVLTRLALTEENNLEQVVLSYYLCICTGCTNHLIRA